MTHSHTVLPLLARWSMVTQSPRRLLVCSLAAAMLVWILSYLLWRLPLQALFRAPIERSAKCPHCGSSDVRPSFVASRIDMIRRKIGLVPFRCRGCANRFVSRCREGLRGELFEEVDPGLYS
jgi:hypothetical protein